MTRPFVLVQLSDLHVGAVWASPDPVAGLEAAVRAVLDMPFRPDAVLVSGDLSDHGTDSEYEQVVDLLAPLAAPVYVVPGNHDDRRALHRHFGVPGAAGEPVQYSVDLGAMRLVVLDTTRPGEDPGALDEERLAWLDAELSSGPALPTVVAMHHPPVETGIPTCDESGLPPADRRGLAEVVLRHEHVRRLVAGHVHRAVYGQLAGRPVSTAPSTYVQLRLHFHTRDVALAEREPAGFAVHALLDGEVVSHVQPFA
ncbi:MAG TPA: phosphodiesterase [Actinomycetota bacterium]|nr:phosphodiesterase [Actinomycetota bacterium]